MIPKSLGSPPIPNKEFYLAQNANSPEVYKSCSKVNVSRWATVDVEPAVNSGHHGESGS